MQNPSQDIFAFNKSREEVLEYLQTSPTGLNEAAVQKRQTHYGFNCLNAAQKDPWWMRLLRQFNSSVIAVLIAAALLSGFIGEWIESSAILCIVFLNGMIGYFQEARAEKTLESLKNLSAPHAHTVRGGKSMVVAAKELVPGDFIELAAGDLIPADCRLYASFGVYTQEASLTGESEPVAKNEMMVLDKETSLAEQCNMLFSGTTLSSGKAQAIVVNTGMNSEIGRIAQLLEAEKIEETPLQKRLSDLGRKLILLCLCTVFLVALLQWLRGSSLSQIFIFSISLAVAAVPEGLPAVVTLALAFGLTRMASRHALIRRLASVETLGSVTVVCSDKTGTLTRNEMTVTSVFTCNDSFAVEGTGYLPAGGFILSQTGKHISVQNYPSLLLLLRAAVLCNDARLILQEGKWQVDGDPTEGALLVAAAKAQIWPRDLEETIVDEIPFAAERKMMSVATLSKQQTTRVYVKGAPESVLQRCQHMMEGSRQTTLPDDRKKILLGHGQQMASDALRVLAFACKDVPPTGVEKSGYETDLTFIGMVGMIDPPRAEATSAVKKCKSAGIKPVMITGDHPATAKAIALQLGIAQERDEAITGIMLDKMSADELREQVPDISVYARVSPEHKLRVIKAWQQRGQIVAMTGDGVNDAPAVKAADIGIAMGLAGTDVTKEASAMVLTDDNFSTIINAIEEGRGIYDNIQNVVRFLIAGNTGEILLVLAAAVLGWPTPLLAIQILWINLISDGLPALAIATETPELGIMRRPPRPVHSPFITWQSGLPTLFHGFLLAAVSLLGFWWFLYVEHRGVNHAQAVAFSVCALSQLAYSFSCRSRRYTLLDLGPLSNKALVLTAAASSLLQISIILIPIFHPFFFKDPPHFDTATWFMVALLSLLPVSIVELIKAFSLQIMRSKQAN